MSRPNPPDRRPPGTHQPGHQRTGHERTDHERTGHERPLRTLVVDDEPLARARLESLVDRHADLEPVGVCRDGEEAIAAIEREAPDLVFLDVQMPEIDGFEVLARIRADPLPSVVFVTAFDRHAVAAFEVDAVDYLLKPFEDERFEAAVERVLRERRDGDLDRLSRRLVRVLEHRARGPADAPAPFAVHGRERIDLVPVIEVEWIAAEGAYVRLHSIGGARHLVRDSLRRLERVLDEHGFARVHRGTLVRLDRIRTLHPLFRGEYQIELASGERVKLSRSYSREIRRRLGLSP